MISKNLSFKERILEVASTGNGLLYVLSPTTLRCFSKEGKEKTPWNLDSPPRSKLAITVHGWGLVCQNHIRTATASRYHGLNIPAEKKVTFVGERLSDYKEGELLLENEKVLFTDENTGYVWSSQVYTPQLVRELKETATGIEDGEKIIVVRNANETFGKIVAGTFICGNMFGTLIRIEDKVFRYSLSGVERRLIATISESRVENEVLLGAIVKQNIFALGWNENGVGVVLLMQINLRKKLNWYLKAVIGFFFLICFLSLIFGI